MAHVETLLNDSAGQYARDMDSSHATLREEMGALFLKEKTARESSHSALTAAVRTLEVMSPAECEAAVAEAEAWGAAN